MQALKIITTIFNIIFLLIIWFFSRSLSWSKEDDRFSIVGFGSMMILYLANIALIWWR